MTDYGPTPAVGYAVPLVTHDHAGETILYTPGADVAAGDVVVQGSMAGIALRAIPANTQGALTIEGSFIFPKAASDGGMAVGTLAYWDATNHVATATASGNTYLGKVELTALTAATSVQVQVEAVAQGYKQMAFQAQLASDANAATIVTTVNALLTKLIGSGIMAAS